MEKFYYFRMTNIVQYIFVRGDLLLKEGWPVGAVIAQACHAATASIHLFYSDESTQQYLRDLDNMHKVIIEAPGLDDLLKVSEKLKEGGIDHKLWIEQPEDFPTCLALKPYPKQEVQKYFKKYKLYKGPEIVKKE